MTERRRARGVRRGWYLLLLCWALPALPDAAAPDRPDSMHHVALLEAALVHYQQLATQPGLTGLPPLPERVVREGQSYSGIAALRTLLVALGDMQEAMVTPEPVVASDAEADSGVDANAAVPLVLDATLVAALKHFQERHGLTQDGVLGPATWRALTTPLGARVRQIERTLQRWRSLPPNPYRRALFINIPRFRLYAMAGMDDREAALLQMDVVVGRTLQKMRTPTFTADLTHLIFSPWWEVPRSIALAEILPAARRNARYLSARNFELVDPAGKVVTYSPAALVALARGTVRVRQRPGNNNALGAVKFMLPNPDDVYLHDTPERELFAHSRRAFSHGCVRVAEPALLAQWLLAEDAAWSADRVAEAMRGAEPVTVNLAEPVRVYFTYGTAIAREDGSVLFLEDLYGLDAD